MDFGLTDEQQLLVESLKEYADRYFDDESVRQMYENHQVSAEAQDAYRDAGFPFMGLPEEVGGIPTDHVTLGLMTEKLYEFTGAMTPFMTGMLACADLAEFGTPEQSSVIMEEYEKSGQSVAALCLSEPAAGSDNQGMTMTSKKQADGTYVLNGQKTWVTLAHLSVYTSVVAKDEDPSYENDKYSLWMVPNGIEGYTYGGLEKIGQQIVPFVDCFFDNVVLTEDMRLGEPGEGWKLLMKKLEFERCLVVAQALGQAQAVMNEVGPYCSERICFQKPIGHLSAIQQHLVEMETILDNVRTRLYKVTTMLDQGKSTRLESALLKAYACKNLTKVAEHALSIYAGIGYTKEMSAGRIWNDLKGYEFAGGTNEIMDYIAGRQLVKKYKNK